MCLFISSIKKGNSVNPSLSIKFFPSLRRVNLASNFSTIVLEYSKGIISSSTADIAILILVIFLSDYNLIGVLQIQLIQVWV